MGIENNHVNTISLQDAYSLIKKEDDLLIIDARSNSLYNSGHLPNAINIDAFCDFVDELLMALDRQMKYLIYCTTHIRADMLTRKMLDLGFSSLLIMSEGFLRWNGAGYPVEK
ncbi:MAG: rhodanese-like domain-containing protein [Carboxylicivirga sp.]|jgi:rhodanese-related sulfurtransferase|nr:rhodanese-like domain-containing protein [Carboxylicivirga sp.]